MKYPKNYLQIQQGSAEWFNARCGLVTASRIADVVGKLKSGKYSEKRENYKMELLSEVLTGQPFEHFVSVPMQWGIDQEPLARANYEFKAGIEVERIGFILHPRIPRCGASPDSLVGEDGLLEIKCPNTTTHIEYFLGEVVPEEYKPQMYWQMACAQRDWVDFVSYDPRLPEDFALFIKRLDWDEDVIRSMEAEVEKFISELNAMCEMLQSRRKPHELVTTVPAAEIPREL